MNREIERRFLVHPERLPQLVRGKKIIQAYLSSDPVVRVRLKGNRAYLTIKKKWNYIIREEYEYQIPLKDAKKLIKDSICRVEKTRFNFKLNGDTWEIDKFEGKNMGLIIAEIELSKPYENFQKPLWLSREITKDYKYLNVNLANKPYLVWE